MKVMVIGADGQLGTDLCKALRDVELIPLTHADIDVCDAASVKKAFASHIPDVVINTAACHTDGSETEPDTAYRVNALGPRNLAVAAQEYSAKLVSLSTDYIFGGDEERCAPYTEYDMPAPVNTCGWSKLAGEKYIQYLCRKHFIVRASGLFGVRGSGAKGGNFVETILRIAGEKGEISVVNDQVFSPTYTRDLAAKIAWLIETEYYGIMHITNSGACSWYEFAVAAIKLTGSKAGHIPITSAQYPQKARRPNYSVLGNYQLRLLGADDMRPWQEALEAYLKEKGHL